MYFHLQGKLKLTNDDHESHLSVDIEWIHYTYKGMVLLWLFIFVFWHYNWIQFRKVSFFWWKQSNKFIENGPLLLQTMAQFNKWLYFSRFFYNLCALIEIWNVDIMWVKKARNYLSSIVYQNALQNWSNCYLFQSKDV